MSFTSCDADNFSNRETAAPTYLSHGDLLFSMHAEVIVGLLDVKEGTISVLLRNKVVALIVVILSEGQPEEHVQFRILEIGQD